MPGRDDGSRARRAADRRRSLRALRRRRRARDGRGCGGARGAGRSRAARRGARSAARRGAGRICSSGSCSARVEPALGRAHPTFLTHWPAAQAALARRDPADPRVAERFELFVCGMELANAFIELTDAAEQRARFAADRARRHAINGADDWPLDEDFLAALAHGMPASGGIALGFDRLAMLASGADRIAQVQWLPLGYVAAAVHVTTPPRVCLARPQCRGNGHFTLPLRLRARWSALK